MSEEQVVSEETKSEYQAPSLEELFSQPSGVPSNGNGKVEAEKETKETDTEEVKTEEVKTDDTEKEEEKTEDKSEEVKPDFESDDNPYKKEATKLKKQYQDTQAWGNKAHMKLKELGVDGYQEEMTEEEQKADAAFREREIASYAAALEIYGEEKVRNLLYAENAPFKAVEDDPAIAFRIKSAKAPVLEALKVVKEHEFFGKYGNDVEKIPDKIKKEFEAELREKITKEFQKKLSNKEKLPSTLSGVKSAEVKEEEKAFAITPLKELFG